MLFLFIAKKMKNRVTQSDIARIAGVSIFTVSCAINNRRGDNVRISEETRQRVLDVAKQLGYKPNLLAQGLKTQKTGLLAILVPDLTNPFYPLFIRGAQKFAGQKGYQVLVFDSNSSKELEIAFIDSILQRMVDGALMYGFHLSPTDIQPLLDAEIPFLDLTGENLNGNSIIQNDPEKGIFDLMQHLFDKGHRRIAHIGGHQDIPPGKKRFEAYKKALAMANIEFDQTLVRFGNFTTEGVRDFTTSIFSSQPVSNRPTALFAANDVMAIEAMETLHSMGLRIPQDVAVCGFDNIPEAKVVNPHLTTVDRNSQIIGQKASKSILQMITNSADFKPEKINITCEIIIRDST